ncbi:bifunctional riboflavin kinase/FAD synthetase [Marinobacterium sp. LSUCC0821]|jgi:riboflavin kinase/FMN adenylyltransferase|uniref:bifunctional riboflavin kinase/FAD synthetase n=1 Tax=Marinobacterium sp. LSUCC0821 TaxID=2668067 RepID=UPI0014516066|nr:bifunctional riboflavin kinase/FAD synthetase [Marinobacterium sp. LSUCC0821]QJD71486.1 bifunctional riboflavin kinase/FAD synthetase [Marinobacterium sp. LSUCC0821]
MELIRGLHNLRERHRGCVATIGNFDGVHRGHQQVLSGVRRKAQELGVPSVVIIFEPQPREFFAPDAAPPRLTRFGEKIRLLEAEGVDRVLCLSFNERLRALSAEQFIESLLLEGLGVKHFVVGDDFRFGCDRRGDYALLKAAGQRHGFTVAETETLILEDERVSSSRIREALGANNLMLASRLLGRRYRVTGRVQHGQKIGRELGAPTANVRMHKYACPLKGVYAVRGHLRSAQFNGVCNVGSRPTVNGVRPVLEVHLLDFKGDLYGELLSVEFLHPMRPEKRFDGLDALREQIAKDISAARTWFASANT